MTGGNDQNIGPWIVRAWECHAKTTVGRMVDGEFVPLAECSGFGDSSHDAEQSAAMIVAALSHPLPPLHNPEHDAPFAAFVQAMADELRANAHKGDRAGWLMMSEREAVSEVLYHAAKLAYAARKHRHERTHGDDVLEFAADVANCALMVADVCRVLHSGAPIKAVRDGLTTTGDQVHG
jgi:hypothetical protein